MALKRRYKIRLVVQGLRSGKLLYQSIKEAGVGQNTFYRWMKQSSRLSGLIEKARGTCTDLRVGMIEDALFKNAIGGNLGAQCFFLTNFAPHKYKNNRDNYAPPSAQEQVLLNSDVEILSDNEKKESDAMLKEFEE